MPSGLYTPIVEKLQLQIPADPDPTKIPGAIGTVSYS
jgi:hypothetical protein